jgi:hypothetical protein
MPTTAFYIKHFLPTTIYSSLHRNNPSARKVKQNTISLFPFITMYNILITMQEQKNVTLLNKCFY